MLLKVLNFIEGIKLFCKEDYCGTYFFFANIAVKHFHVFSLKDVCEGRTLQVRAWAWLALGLGLACAWLGLGLGLRLAWAWLGVLLVT